LLQASGLQPEERPLAVHVTLARHAAAVVRHPIAPALAWHVGAFALVASELSTEGARYRVVSSWPLIANA
jgi:2'-5' RNA ligase